MTTDCVLDTSALIAYVREEPGWERVQERLRFGRRFMHAVNMAEFLYAAPNRMPERFTPDSALAWFYAADIDVANLFDPDFLRLSAQIRLKEKSLNVGDGLAVALASKLNLPLVTAEGNFKRTHEYARIELIRERKT